MFKKIFKTYEQLQTNLLLDILFENINLFYGEFRNGTFVIKSMRNISKSKEKLLRKRYNENVNKRVENHKEFMVAINEYVPNSFISKLRFNLFFKKQDSRMTKMVKNQNIIFEVE